MKWGVRKKHYSKEELTNAKKVVDSTKQMNESIRLANQNSLNRAAMMDAFVAYKLNREAFD